MTSATAAVKANTRQSSARSIATGTGRPVRAADIRRVIDQPSPTAASAPATDSANASLISIDTSARREAPSARRTATSRERPAARARRRPARFVHVTSNTRPATPINTARNGATNSLPTPGTRLAGVARKPIRR